MSTYEANPSSPAAGEPDEVLGEGDADAEGVGVVAVALADGAGLAVADGLGAAPPWHDAPLMVQSEGCPASPVDVVTKPTETNDGAGCGRGCLRTA